MIVLTLFSVVLFFQGNKPNLIPGKLLADDPGKEDEFGNSVAIGEDILAIGAPEEDGGPGDPIFNAGAVYLYEKDPENGDQWIFFKKLMVTEDQDVDYFGTTVMFSEDLLFVGAPRHGVGGKVFIYAKDEGGADNWGQIQVIGPENPEAFDSFGGHLAISGNTLVVGASGDDEAGISAGAVYIFERDLVEPGIWSFVLKLTAPSPQSYAGFSVAAIDGDTLVVGVSQQDYGGFTDSGIAYIFYRDEGGPNAWGMVDLIKAEDAHWEDEFGYAVAIKGDTISVGVPGEDGGPLDPLSNTGAVMLFLRDLGGPDNWGQYKVLYSGDATEDDRLGNALYMDGTALLVGAPVKDGLGFAAEDAGAAYIFEKDFGGPANWGQSTILTAIDYENQDYFGNATAIYQDTILVGAKYDDGPPEMYLSNAGAAYYFDYIKVAEKIFVPRISNCIIYHQDDFSNPNSGWPQVDTGEVLYEYLDKEYRVLVRPPFALAGAHPGLVFSDYLVSIQVRNINNVNGSYGLLFSQVADWSGFYTFEIDKFKHFEIWLWDGSWALLEEGTAPSLKSGGMSNTLAVERFGPSIRAYANNVEIASLEHPEFTGMLRMGVWVTGGSNENLDVRFDNFKLEPVGCGWSNGAPIDSIDSSIQPPGGPTGPNHLELSIPRRDE